MACVLAISSQVARGAVGLNAVLPALHAFGHETIALPTILLSNHPGHERFAGERIDPALLTRMVATLDSNGWLGEVDAVLTGYLPSVEHVALAAATFAMVRARNPTARLFCDPVLGDDPKGLYIAADAAAALRDRLLPSAEYAFPNRFELAWLSGQNVGDERSAHAAATGLPPKWVVATSVPGAAGQLSTLAIGPDETWVSSLPELARVPNGTGDLLAAIFTAAILDGTPQARALGTAVAAVAEVIAASVGSNELRLVGVLASACVQAPALTRRL